MMERRRKPLSEIAIQSPVSSSASSLRHWFLSLDYFIFLISLDWSPFYGPNPDRLFSFRASISVSFLFTLFAFSVCFFIAHSSSDYWFCFCICVWFAKRFIVQHSDHVMLHRCILTIRALREEKTSGRFVISVRRDLFIYWFSSSTFIFCELLVVE